MTLVTHRISTIDGHFPTTAQLAAGELAVNGRNGLIFLKKVVGTTETVEKFLPVSQMYLLEQLTSLITDIIPTGFLRLFAYNGYLYTKYGANAGKMLLNEDHYALLSGALGQFFPFILYGSDSAGITAVDCTGGPSPQIFISQSVSYSTLQLNNINYDNGLTGLIFITLGSSSYKLRVPIDLTGYMLMSDDVWTWDNFNNSIKSVVEYVTGPPTYATFTCTHHGYTTGSYVKIAGYSGNKASYNGVHKLTSVDLNTFRIDVAYQASGTATTPTVVAQEKIFNIPDYNYTHIYELSCNSDTGDLYITLRNKVKRY